MQSRLVAVHTKPNQSSCDVSWTGSKKRCKRKPSRTDIRQALKLNGIYELPFGSKRHFLGNVHNPASQLLSWLAGTNLLFRNAPPHASTQWGVSIEPAYDSAS